MQKAKDDQTTKALLRKGAVKESSRKLRWKRLDGTRKEGEV